MMLKALPLVHFWSVLLLKEQMMTSVRKTLKTLVWPVQNQLISSKICLENNHKIGRFLLIAFWWSLPRRLPRNYSKIGRFFCEFVPKNTAKFDFFFLDLSEALFFTLYNDFESFLMLHFWTLGSWYCFTVFADYSTCGNRTTYFWGNCSNWNWYEAF